eukprot:m51a1_g14377 hypothetical protein (338) ;mRNA; r:275960-277235
MRSLCVAALLLSLLRGLCVALDAVDEAAAALVDAVAGHGAALDWALADKGAVRAVSASLASVDVVVVTAPADTSLAVDPRSFAAAALSPAVDSVQGPAFLGPVYNHVQRWSLRVFLRKKAVCDQGLQANVTLEYELVDSSGEGNETGSFVVRLAGFESWCPRAANSSASLALGGFQQTFAEQSSASPVLLFFLNQTVHVRVHVETPLALDRVALTRVLLYGSALRAPVSLTSGDDGAALGFAREGCPARVEDPGNWACFRFCLAPGRVLPRMSLSVASTVTVTIHGARRGAVERSVEHVTSLFVISPGRVVDDDASGARTFGAGLAAPLAALALALR